MLVMSCIEGWVLDEGERERERERERVFVLEAAGVKVRWSAWEERPRGRHWQGEAGGKREGRG